MVWSLTESQTSWSVKWALGSITTNKAGGGDGIPAELFQILKDGETMETVTYFILGGSKNTTNGDHSHEIKDICSLEEKLWPTYTAY